MTPLTGIRLRSTTKFDFDPPRGRELLVEKAHAGLSVFFFFWLLD